MSHAIGTRTELLGTLHCDSPVHVGGWESTAEADLAVALDGSGEPVLPGTSIAGAIRSYLAGPAGFSRADIDAMFGNVVKGSQDGSPSWIRVDDATLVEDAQHIGAGVPVTRDGVGIDRNAGSAAKGFLYTRQVLPPGTRFAFRIVVDRPSSAATGLPALLTRALDAIVAGLHGGAVPIGAGRGRGFAKVRLIDPVRRQADLADPVGMVAWLTGSVPFHSLPSIAEPPADRQLRITIGWRPLTPLLVRDSIDNAAAGTLPLTTLDAEGRVRLLLPGSSIRGAVRSHAERIVRTLTGQPAPRDEEPDDSAAAAAGSGSRAGSTSGRRRGPFDEALRHPPIGVGALFGVSPEPGPDSPGWRGTIAFADCHSRSSVTPETWQQVVTCAPAGDATTEHSRPGRQQRNAERTTARAELLALINGAAAAFQLGISDHVAIDRWTGGASDHRLFSVLEPAAGLPWEPMQITVDTARLDDAARLDGTAGSGAGNSDAAPNRKAATPLGARLALPLLLLVLRDLRDGWISLGFGGTRGRGQIAVTSIEFSGTGLAEPWQSLVGLDLDQIIDAPPAPVVEAMATWTSHFEAEAA